MHPFERSHSRYAYGRRVERLGAHLASVLPHGATVLDVGCGDGKVAHLVQAQRRDLMVCGMDVLVRDHTEIPVERFDGATIPRDDRSVDVVMFVDVLHHTEDPEVLLREAGRVSRASVVIKDHTRDGVLAGATLRFMDRVGNARHGVVLPYNYWTRPRWLETLGRLGLTVGAWHEDLRLYPAWADWVFGRSLHFIARCDVPGAARP
jgi:SAM-dependent methyltransferase